MKKYITQSQYNYQTDPRTVEAKNTEPTLTLPGQCLTIEQIFAKWATGAPVTGVKNNPQYLDTDNYNSPDLEKLKNADLVDKEEFSKKLGEQMKNIDKKQKADAEAAAAQKEKDEEAAWLAKAEKHQLSKKAGKSDPDNKPKDDAGTTPH